MLTSLSAIRCDTRNIFGENDSQSTENQVRHCEIDENAISARHTLPNASRCDSAGTMDQRY